MNKQFSNTQGGLTVIELLMLASLTAVLAALAIMIINPIAHVASSRNAVRFSDVNVLANALAQYREDHGGRLPEGIATLPREICRERVSPELCRGSGLVDLSLLVPSYLHTLPIDPLESNKFGTAYAVAATVDGRISVTALRAEDGDAVLVRQ